MAGWQKAMPSLKFKLNGIETNSYWTQAGENKAPGMLRMGWIRRLRVDRQLHLSVHDRGRQVRLVQLV